MATYKLCRFNSMLRIKCGHGFEIIAGSQLAKLILLVSIILLFSILRRSLNNVGKHVHILVVCAHDCHVNLGYFKTTEENIRPYYYKYYYVASTMNATSTLDPITLP